MKPIFIFIHIGKTAGTSIAEVFGRIFDGPEVISGFTRSEITGTGMTQTSVAAEMLKKRYQEKEIVSCVSGHINFGIHRYLPTDNVLYFTMMRHPVKRSISNFSYNKAHSIVHALKKIDTLDDYLEKYPTGHFWFSNTQFRCLADDTRFDGDGFTIEDEVLGAEEITPEAYSEVMTKLDAQDFFVGNVEMINESMVILAGLLDLPLARLVVGKKNVTPKKYDVSPEALQRIEELNKYDFRIYDHYRSKFEALIKDLGQDFSDDLKYYEKLCANPEFLTKRSCAARKATWPGFLRKNVNRICRNLRLQAGVEDIPGLVKKGDASEECHKFAEPSWDIMGHANNPTIIQYSRDPKKEIRTILYYTDDINARIMKMAWGLKRLNRRIEVIFRNDSFFDYESYFDAAYKVDSDEEAYRLAMDISPDVCHVCSSSIDQRTVDMCTKKPFPVVLDLYDIWTEGLYNHFPERSAMTLEAMAQTDGLCCRDPRYLITKRVCNAKLPKYITIFPDYCWDMDDISVSEFKKDKGEVHVVSVGALFKDKQLENMVQLFTERGIHFHIYPRWDFSPSLGRWRIDDYFKELIEISKTNLYLHIHEPVDLKQLNEELKQYDFGLSVNGSRKLGFDPSNSKVTEDLLRTTYSMRVSDYLEAGLFVICNKEMEYIAGILKKYNVYVDSDRIINDDAKEYLLNFKNTENMDFLFRNILKRHSITGNIDRLDRFYSKVIWQARTTRDLSKSRIMASRKPSSKKTLDDTATELIKEKFTLIIPTYNRSEELARLLTFMERLKIRFPVLVLDSSSEQANREQNQSIVASCNINVEYHEFDSSMLPFKKIYKGLKLVNTPYCSMCADDDLLVPGSLPDLIAFLEAKPDYIGAQGFSFRFHIDSHQLIFEKVEYSGKSNDNDDPFMRLKTLFECYESCNYAVFRTKVFHDVFEAIEPYDNVWTCELLSCALFLTEGKVARIPVQYYGRSSGPCADFGQCHPLDFICDSIPGQFQAYGELRATLLPALEKKYQGRVDKVAIGHIIDLIFMLYFSEYYQRPIIEASLDLNIQTKVLKTSDVVNSNVRIGQCPIRHGVAQARAATGNPVSTEHRLKEFMKTSPLTRSFTEHVLDPCWQRVKHLRILLKYCGQFAMGGMNYVPRKVLGELEKRQAAILRFKERVNTSMLAKPIRPFLYLVWRMMKALYNLKIPLPSLGVSSSSETVFGRRTADGLIRYYVFKSEFTEFLEEYPGLASKQDIDQLLTVLNEYTKERR